MRILCSLRWVALSLLLGLGTAGPALADPFAITYTGTASGSGIPGINSGETYDVTLVFDNGSATAVSQVWGGADLQCAIWRFNTARNFVFTNDLVNDPPSTGGSATTDGTGALTANFTSVNNTPADPTYYTVAGGALTPDVLWFANGFNAVFVDNSGNVLDASGGVQMAPGNWTNPVPFSGNCAGLVLGAAPPTIPTLSDFALWLMTLSLMVAGFFYTRRWATA